MYDCYGYKDHSRPPAVSFHIYMDAMLPFGNQGNTHVARTLMLNLKEYKYTMGGK